MFLKQLFQRLKLKSTNNTNNPIYGYDAQRHCNYISRDSLSKSQGKLVVFLGKHFCFNMKSTNFLKIDMSIL